MTVKRILELLSKYLPSFAVTVIKKGGEEDEVSWLGHSLSPEEVAEALEKAEAENVRQEITPIPVEPGGPWTPSPYDPNKFSNPTSTCPKCGITLEPVMHYVCSDSQCPVGLGGTTVCKNEATPGGNVGPAASDSTGAPFKESVSTTLDPEEDI